MLHEHMDAVKEQRGAGKCALMSLRSDKIFAFQRNSIKMSVEFMTAHLLRYFHLRL